MPIWHISGKVAGPPRGEGCSAGVQLKPVHALAFSQGKVGDQ